MSDYLISERVSRKLWDNHQVTEKEVMECFENREGSFLEDVRPQHRTDPPTLWFISRTNDGRTLKVVFVYEKQLKQFIIKTAYVPNQVELNIYRN